MQASVIIPAYNAEATLAECVAACLNQTLPAYEIIVVDDGSTDDTAGIAAAFPVRCVRQGNAGPASARNRGAAGAAGDVLVFTDADCVPEPDWLERLQEGFDEGVAAVGGTYGIANPESLLARMVHEEIAARHASLPREVDFLGSFNAAYRREVFEALNGFDEDFRQASAEDNDLAYRLQDLGERMRFVPGARVAHYHPTRLWPYLRTQMRHGYWRVQLYAKHPHRANRGDRYAGFVDLILPPFALVVACSIPFAVLGTPFAQPWIAAALFYGAMRAALPLRLVCRTCDPSMLAFFVVGLFRDVARALGMVSGMRRLLWRFPVEPGL